MTDSLHLRRPVVKLVVDVMHRFHFDFSILLLLLVRQFQCSHDIGLTKSFGALALQRYFGQTLHCS